MRLPRWQSSKEVFAVERIARNALKATRRLTSATVDTVVAALEAKRSDLRLRKERNELVIEQLAQFPRDQGRVGAKVAARLVAEQHRLDEIVFAGLQRLAESEQPDSADESADEVDDDWLDAFGREAVLQSRVDVREAFARILAGEIREPGTFSIRALRTVGALTQSTATLFQRATSLRVGLEVMATVEGGGQRLLVLDARVPALDGQLGANALEKEGLGYGALTQLTENGLLQPDYNSWYDYKLAVQGAMPGNTPVLPLVRQNRRWTMLHVPGSQGGLDAKISGAGFTGVGKELMRIVDIEEDPAFLERMRAYLRTRSFDLAPPLDKRA